MTRRPDTANLSRTDTSSTERSQETTAPARKIAAIAVVLEADRPRSGSFAQSLEGIDRIVIARGTDRRAERDGKELTIELADRRISKPHAAIERRGESFVLTDLGSSNGTFLGGFGTGERVTKSELPTDCLFSAGHCAFTILPDAGPVLARPVKPWPFATLSSALAHELGRLERVAPSLLPLLMLGETGTGKEVLARAVHERSGRPGAFVAVNCGALPRNLVEAQLFGHRSGAFSGAVRDELGFVRAADHGTLFLDEIGDLALDAQTSLLRVLQEKEVTPVGTFHPVKVDVRVLSATHRPLASLVAAGTFRADLFARLSGFSFQVPPLRDRLFDVGELCASFWPDADPEMAIQPAAAQALLSYDYPLNVRELKLALEAAFILSEGTLKRGDLPEAIRGGARASAPPSRSRPAQEIALSPTDAALREELTQRLAASGHNVSQVAREMGKARQQVQRWMKRFGLGDT